MQARDLDVLEPKSPEDVYKTHLEKRSTSASVDSARQVSVISDDLR